MLLSLGLPNDTNYSQTQPNECSLPGHLLPRWTFAALSKENTHLPINHSYDFVILDDDIRGVKMVMRKYQVCILARDQYQWNVNQGSAHGDTFDPGSDQDIDSVNN